jgi:hypothetical protein
MLQAFRAAGFAAAAFLVAFTTAWSPAQAASVSHAGTVTTPAVAAFQHAVAGGEISELGLNAIGLGQPVAPAIGAGPIVGAGLAAMIAAQGAIETADSEQDCLANAVYFEARGEPLEGQLAVAEVVLNRAGSGRYPTTICAVVTQPAQFSFVRRGVIPRADRASEAWRRAVAVARIAQSRAMRMLPDNVLWYHANYVSPSWGRRLDRNTQIGLHIFYS